MNEPSFSPLDQHTMERIAEQAAEKALSGLFAKYGIDIEDPRQVQMDMAHLRRWRLAVEGAGRRGFMTATAIIVTGIFAVLWIGFQSVIHLPR